MITVKRAAEICWDNVPDSYKKTEFAKAFGDCISAMDDIAESDNHNHNRHPESERIRSFSERICAATSDIDIFTGHPQLNYREDWAGEWEIRNTDLDAIGYFLMWVHRAGENKHVLNDIFGCVVKSVALKRTVQAFERYRETGLKPDHCKLLAKMRWEMDMTRGDWTSLFVQGKRPFGNSSIDYDIVSRAGWKFRPGEDDEDEMHPDQVEQAWNLFDELIFAAPDAAKAALETLGPVGIPTDPRKEP